MQTIRLLFNLAFILLTASGFSQLVELNVGQQAYVPDQFQSSWVTHPELTGSEHSVVYFRNEFDLSEKPDSFIINISADNHYRLHVNGKWLAEGPQLSDILHWKYETLDLAPYLHSGKNVVAVEVYNWGYLRHFGMQSLHTSLIVNAFSPNAAILRTSGGSDNWNCYWNKGAKGKEIKWRSDDRDIIGGLYANNPTDSLNVTSDHVGWKAVNYDDAAWSATKFLEWATTAGGSFAWILEPRNLPLQTRHVKRFANVVRSENIKIDDAFLQGGRQITIPPNTTASFLIDNKVISIGYPQLDFSNGKNAIVKITYAENLFLSNKEKGHRDSIDGQFIVGYHDFLIPDGSVDRTYIPTWLRGFRFVQIDIETSDEPLILKDYLFHKSQTSIPVQASFNCDNEMYNAIFGICERTASMCVQDYYLSDGYYETMQYIGDTKIHSLLWQALSGDDQHTRNALRQFHQSRKPDGNLLGAYPLRTTFIFSTYSVMWVDMLWDYYVYSGDKEYLNEYTSGIRHTLDGFDKYIKENGLVKKPPYNYFVDWYIDADKETFGMAPKSKGGDNSAVVTLHYVHALQSAAKIFDELGEPEAARAYLTRANEIKEAVYAQCYDIDRGLFATRLTKDYFDMHANIMAVLTDAVPASEHKRILSTILEDEGISPATYYYRYFLFEALKKAGMETLFDLAQKPWEDLVNVGMTTTLERLEQGDKPTRSEVHPWSSSPAYFYFNMIAGIAPRHIGWKNIIVKPNFGILNHINGTYPTPEGIIEFELKKRKRGGITGKIKLPEGMQGIYQANGKQVVLESGWNRVTK